MLYQLDKIKTTTVSKRVMNTVHICQFYNIISSKLFLHNLANKTVPHLTVSNTTQSVLVCVCVLGVRRCARLNIKCVFVCVRYVCVCVRARAFAVSVTCEGASELVVFKTSPWCSKAFKARTEVTAP